MPAWQVCVCVPKWRVISREGSPVRKEAAHHLKVSFAVLRCFQDADKRDRRETAERASEGKKGSSGDREPSHAPVSRLHVCSENVFVATRDSCKGNPSFPLQSLSRGLPATELLPSLLITSALFRPGRTNKAAVAWV